MCGIILLQGPNANVRLTDCLHRLKHRGPDDLGVWSDGDVALAFARLAINGKGLIGRQPYQHRKLIGAINGEIYNHKELARSFGFMVSACDTEIVLPLFELRGSKIIDDLDGFYSAVVFDPATRELFCLRDHIGKKPLFVGRSQSELFITSELKALHRVDWFKLLPCGATRIELDTGDIKQLVEHQLLRHQEDFVTLFEEAVRKRIPHDDQPVGIFLSGGLDSSLVAATASRLRDDIKYFTLTSLDSSDGRAVDAVVTALGLQHVKTVSIPLHTHISKLIESIVYTTESYNPSIVSNGLATFLLAQAAHKDGIKVVLTGDGADELFGGYHFFREQDPWYEVRGRLIDDMQFTELRRLDMACMAHGVEARCPFLDRTIRSFSDQLAYNEMYNGEENKVLLRQQFKGVLPMEVLHRPKTSFDVGSGVRREVVQYLRRNGKSEREELLALWKQHFTFDVSEPYFYSYPVFDMVIDQRGETHR